MDSVIVEGIFGGSYVQDWTVGRILTLHFALGLVSAAIMLGHLTAVHRIRPAGSNFMASDGSLSLSDVIFKDSASILFLVMLVLVPILGATIHPDNFGTYSRLVTPAHIEPEVYFLLLFSAF